MFGRRIFKTTHLRSYIYLFGRLNDTATKGPFHNAVLIHRRYCTAKSVSDIARSFSSLKTKRRLQKKMFKHASQVKEAQEYDIFAAATSDEYDMGAIAEAFTKQDIYVESSILLSNQLSSDGSAKLGNREVIDSHEVLHFLSRDGTAETGEIFVFRDGAVICWNIPGAERREVLSMLKKYQQGQYSDEIIDQESETLQYRYTDGPSRLKSSINLFLLGENGDKSLEKFTVSNVLAMSVKLGLWESSLDLYIENIEYVTEELGRSGKVVLNQAAVLQHMGRLFSLRHLINLSSDLLDTPDFYWDHEHLEQLYHRMSSHYSIQKRTSVMNTKLNHCLELMELLKSNLSERHSSRLEWIIIILIMVEVFFEMLHYII